MRVIPRSGVKFKKWVDARNSIRHLPKLIAEVQVPWELLAVVGDASYAATGTHVIRMNRVKFAAANSKRSKIASELRDLSRKLRDAGDKNDE